MFWFKLCPRCSGDLFEDRDQYGKFIACMQCGLIRDVSNCEGGVLVISSEPVSAPVEPISDGGWRKRISGGGRHVFKSSAFDAVDMTESAA